MIGDRGEQAVHQDDNDAPANGGKKCGAAINGARQNRRQDDDEHCIKRRLARERTFMPDPDHGQGREKNDDAAQRDLKKGQILRLHSEAEPGSIKL